MSDETRAELRRGLEAVARAATSDSLEAVVDVVCCGHVVSVYATTHLSYLTKLPHLTTAQQLALSILLCESVPLSVLLSACEDAGLFSDGVLSAVAEKARAEERERCANLVEEWVGRDVSRKSLRCRLLIEIDGRHIDGFAPGGPALATGKASTRSLGE